MKLPEKLNGLTELPGLPRWRTILAVMVAVAADGLQIMLLPAAWTFVQSAVDVVAMGLTIWLLGFHLLLLPTFVLEIVPWVDMLPTWTGCVLAVLALRRRNQTTPPPPR
jgi:hypothetical protein